MKKLFFTLFVLVLVFGFNIIRAQDRITTTSKETTSTTTQDTSRTETVPLGEAIEPAETLFEIFVEIAKETVDAVVDTVSDVLGVTEFPQTESLESEFINVPEVQQEQPEEIFSVTNIILNNQGGRQTKISDVTKTEAPTPTPTPADSPTFKEPAPTITKEETGSISCDDALSYYKFLVKRLRETESLETQIKLKREISAAQLNYLYCLRFGKMEVSKQQSNIFSRLFGRK